MIWYKCSSVTKAKSYIFRIGEHCKTLIKCHCLSLSVNTVLQLKGEDNQRYSILYCIVVMAMLLFCFRVRDIPQILRKAMQIAQSGTPGPVFVEFPIDTLYSYPLVKKEAGLKVSSLARHNVHKTSV